MFTGPVPTIKVTVPVPYLDHKKQFSTFLWGKNLPFLHYKLFYKEKLKEENQMYNFLLYVCENFCEQNFTTVPEP